MGGVGNWVYRRVGYRARGKFEGVPCGDRIAGVDAQSQSVIRERLGICVLAIVCVLMIVWKTIIWEGRAIISSRGKRVIRACSISGIRERLVTQ